MESKADVKAIMARFQAGEATSEASHTLPGRAKAPLQPTRSSSPTVPPKRPVMESLSGSAIKIPPKPTLKNSEAPEANKAKPLASKLSSAGISSGDRAETVAKPPEAKAPAPKPSTSKPPLSATLSNSKPAFSKPSAPVPNRPNWVKDDTGGGEAGSTPPKMPPVQQKPISTFSKLRQQTESTATSAAASKPSLPNSAPKPPSNFKEAQSVFNKEAGRPEQPEGGSKAPPTTTNVTPPPKPAASKKPSLRKPSLRVSSFNGDAAPAAAAAATGPKRNPLVNVFALGLAPAKPNRPPTVNLEPFRRGAEGSGNGADTNKPTIPAALTSYPGNHSNHSTSSPPPAPPPLPTLPPRHPGSMVQEEDFYDDIDDVSAPPPPPPAAGHPSQRAKGKEKSDAQDDPEASDKQRQTADQKLDRDKKYLEAEKKEQEARKKFKLIGPLETIHQGKARLDYRGSKTDLPLKQGEDLDIIRVQGNPEGRWLGRNKEGSIGYVKTASVEIDFNSLKRCNVQQEQEVYDDVAPDMSAIKAHGVVLPPLPGQDGEIYDDVVDPNLEVSDADAEVSPAKPRGFLRVFEWSRRTFNDKVVPPPSQFTSDGNSADQPAAAGSDEIYDDVDSQALPPPPQHSSLPGLKFMSKATDMKKQKKMEKEEKEFRKKFKYEGEIRVLYQVTVIPTLTNKKWASKELALKAGETVDVIAKAEDDRLICRSEEGKFGYVSTSNVIMNDSEIYDDIGDECVYDND